MMQDIINITEESDSLEGLFTLNGRLSPELNLQYWINKHLENAGVIDYQNRVCNFDSVFFKRAMELSKYYGKLPGCASIDYIDRVKEEKYVSGIEMLYYSGQYAEICEKYGDQCHYIGFPGQEDYVGYWSSGRLLAINSNSKYKDDIVELLMELTDPNNLKQIEDGVPASKEAIQDCVYWDEWSENWVFEASGGGSYPFADAKGENYLERYLMFLNNLGPWPEDSFVSEIINEEAAAFFEGNQNIDSVCRVINNRVQLYLNEK